MSDKNVPSESGPFWNKFLNKSLESWGELWKKRGTVATNAKRPKVHVPDSRSHLHLLDDGSALAKYFDRLKSSLYDAADEMRSTVYTQSRRPKYFRESGRLSNDGKYFYLKAPGQTGWLFETSETGWIISASEKIIEDNTFYRPAVAWDVVTLFSRGEPGVPPRVLSQRFGPEPISYLVYENWLLEHFDLLPARNEENAH